MRVKALLQKIWNKELLIKLVLSLSAVLIFKLIIMLPHFLRAIRTFDAGR
jgi:hypothetical protein